MRVTEKKDWAKGVTLRHESYSDYMEFYETLISRQGNAHRTIEKVFDDHERSWVGCSSVEEAKRLFLGGWDKPLKSLKEGIDKELDTIERSSRTRMRAAPCGFAPIVPNAIMGLPNAMLAPVKERTGAKVLRFLISISRSCSESAEAIIRKMSRILAQIASLERSGAYRCRLEVFFPAFGGKRQNGDKWSVSCSILVKSEDQPFDAMRLCYPVINPSMLRLLVFAWAESLPLPYDDYYVSGYGHAFEWWDRDSKEAFVDAVREDGERPICVDLNTDVMDTLKGRR